MNPGSADVRSIDALRDWQAALARYRSDAQETLSGIAIEIRRVYEWLAEQQAQWRQAIRQCEEEVVQAKAELAARRFPGFDGRMPDTTVQERNLRRAEARLEHAHERVRACRSWEAKLPALVDEQYHAPARRLGNFLDGDMVRGMAVLDRQVAALERYAELQPDHAPGPSTSQPAPTGPTKLPPLSAPGEETPQPPPGE